MSKKRQSDKKPDRLLITGAFLVDALWELKRTRPANRDHLSEKLAVSFLKRLGPTERSFIFATACKAAPDETIERMVFDMGGPPPMGGV